jgi:hypothetical protein
VPRFEREADHKDVCSETSRAISVFENKADGSELGWNAKYTIERMILILSERNSD